uniref:Eukaryotic translation initiation factor 2-alpha kinase 2 n=1 Tax=Neogobius melanostomus TaxID=47308 RepID=A0A8C6T0Y1_9GOBI
FKDTGPEKNNENGLTASITYSCVVCFDRFNSDFDCIEPLGKGSYGCVYKARHKVLDQYRAIKEIRSKDLPREVLVLANLDHPNIVRYFSCWLQDTGYNSEVKINTKFLFIEMELCEGGTLRRWIHKKNIAPAENSRQRQSLEFARQILSGVEYIHSKKLIHRDLKPENILFGQDGNVRIGDFGLATQDNDDGELVERTEDSGTRSYMAPEQVGVNYDRKVDVFALGLIFFELFWRIGTGHERIKVCKTTCTIGERVNDVCVIVSGWWWSKGPMAQTRLMNTRPMNLSLTLSYIV